MTETSKILARCNTRLALVGAKPLCCGEQPLNDDWWNMFKDGWDLVKEQDQLLLKETRPMHEEWIDMYCNRWVADGKGYMHSVWETESIPQSDLKGGKREPNRRQATLADMSPVLNGAADIGMSFPIGELLEKLGGPFGACSWVAKGRMAKELCNYVKDQANAKKSEAQTRQFEERVTKRSKKHFSF